MAPPDRFLRRYRAITLIFPLAFGAAACAPTPSTAPRNPALLKHESSPPTTRASNTPVFPNAPSKVVAAKALPLLIALPGPEYFIVTETNSTFSAVHQGTKSEVKVRLWTSSRLVDTTQCERELLLLDANAEKRATATRESPVVETHPFTPGPDYRGNVSSTVHAAPDGTISGYVHGIAAGVGHCLAFDAQTQVKGPDAEREVASRLARLLDDIALSVQLRKPETREPEKAPFAR